MSIVKPIQGGGGLPSIENDSEDLADDSESFDNSGTPKSRERSKSVTEDSSRTSPAILAARIQQARQKGKRFARTQSMITPPEFLKKKENEKKRSRRSSSSVLGFDKIKSGGELLDTHESIFKNYNVKCMCSAGNQVWIVGHGIIAIFSSKKCRLLNELKYKDPDDYVIMMRFVHNSQRRNIWAGHKSGKIIIWDVKSKRQIYKITRAHKSRVTDICQVRNRVWTASEDTTIRIWDLRTQKPLDELIDNGYQPARAIVYIPETGKVWTAGDDYQIRIRDAKDGSCQSQVTGFVQGVCQMKKTKDLVWITGTKGSVFIFDAKKMSCIKEIRAYHAKTLTLEATTEEVWSLGQDRVMKVFSIKHQRTVKNIFGTNKEIWVTSLKPVGGGHVWAHCSDGFIRVWSTLGQRTDGVVTSMKSPRKRKKNATLDSTKSPNNSTTSTTGLKNSLPEPIEPKKKITKSTKKKRNNLRKGVVGSSPSKGKRKRRKIGSTSTTKGRRRRSYDEEEEDIDDEFEGEDEEEEIGDLEEDDVIVTPRRKFDKVKKSLRKKRVKKSTGTKRGNQKKRNSRVYELDLSDDDSEDEELLIRKKKKNNKLGSASKKKVSGRKGARSKKTAASRKKVNISQMIGSNASPRNKDDLSSRMLELSSPKTYEVARRLGVGGKDGPLSKSSERPRFGRTGVSSPRTPLVQRGRGRKRGRTGGKTGRGSGRKIASKSPYVQALTKKKSPPKKGTKPTPYVDPRDVPKDLPEGFSKDEYREEMGILRTQLTSASDRIVGFRDRLKKRKVKLKENDLMIKDMTKRYRETQEKLIELQEAGLRSSHEVSVHRKDLERLKEEKKHFMEGLSKEMELGRTVRSYGEILKEVRKQNLRKETLKRELQYSKQDLLSHIKHLKQIHHNFKKMQNQLTTKEKLIASLNDLLAKTEEKGDQKKIETLLGSFREMTVHTEKMRCDLDDRIKENIKNTGFLDQVHDHLSIISENLNVIPFEEARRNEKSIVLNEEDVKSDDDDVQLGKVVGEIMEGSSELFRRTVEVSQIDRIRYYLQEIQKKTLANLRGGGEKTNASEVIKDMLGELREYMLKGGN